MTNELKKPSEIMIGEALAVLVRQMADYIDAEHERGAAFEKDVLERLGELEDWRNGKGPKLEPIAAGTGDPT
jgi:hypothetical protein